MYYVQHVLAPKQPKGWGRMFAAFGLAFAVLVIQVFAMLFGGVLAHNDNAMMTVGELAGGVVALLFIVLLGGRKLAAPSFEGMRETWRIVRWIFLVDAVIAVIDLVSVFFDDSYAIAQWWPLRILLLALMCIGIGLFEEATFRGLVFHGLLARMGITRSGVAWAVVLSSVFFGLMHIDPISMDWGDPSQVAQAVLKVAQTGIFGVAAAAAVLKTGNIWPVALFHGLNDFILMVVAYGMTSEEITTDYVLTGEEGLQAIAIYVVLCLAYIPALVASIRVIRETQLPERGQFYQPRYIAVPVAAAGGALPYQQVGQPAPYAMPMQPAAHVADVPLFPQTQAAGAPRAQQPAQPAPNSTQSQNGYPPYPL